MIPACAAPHINSPNADTANMLFLGTSGLSSISDMSDRGQKLPPSSASVLQPMVNPSGIRQIRQVTSPPLSQVTIVTEFRGVVKTDYCLCQGKVEMSPSRQNRNVPFSLGLGGV